MYLVGGMGHHSTLAYWWRENSSDPNVLSSYCNSGFYCARKVGILWTNLLLSIKDKTIFVANMPSLPLPEYSYSIVTKAYFCLDIYGNISYSKDVKRRRQFQAQPIGL